MIEALSDMLNFRWAKITLYVNKITIQLYYFHSYCYLPIVTLGPDDTPSARGAISYLVNDVLDSFMLNLYI